MNSKPGSQGWREPFQRFSRFVTRRDTGIIALSLVLIIINGVTNTVMVWYAGLPLNAIVDSQYDQIPGLLILFALFTLVNQGSIFAASLNNEWLAFRVVGRIRSHVFFHLLNLGFARNREFHRGDQLSRLNDDSMQVNQLVVMLPLLSFNHVLHLLFYSLMLFWIDIHLAILAAVLLPVFYLHQHLFAGAKHLSAKQLFASRGRLMALEENSLNNIRNINSLVAERPMTEKHRRQFHDFQRKGVRDMGIHLAFQSSLVILIYLLALVIIGTGLYFVQSGSLQAGALLSFILYLGYLSFPIRELTQLGLSVQNYNAAAHRLTEILDSRPFVSTKGDSIRTLQGHIQFRDVSFHYPGNQAIFTRLNLKILAGEKVALVGSSGSGKTTLALLLMRFYDPQQGQILIDGRDIGEWRLDNLRQQIATVWQENFFLQDTIRGNLLLANPEADDTQLISALNLAQAWDFVRDLPQQLDTLLGSGAMDLSVGQYQRLYLAQAILRPCPIIILDEFTSALDSATEEKLLSGLRQHFANRTVIIIAHRFSTVREADKIIYLTGDGQAVMGSHEFLSHHFPDYRQALEWQTRSQSA